MQDKKIMKNKNLLFYSYKFIFNKFVKLTKIQTEDFLIRIPIFFLYFFSFISKKNIKDAYVSLGSFGDLTKNYIIDKCLDDNAYTKEYIKLIKNYFSSSLEKYNEDSLEEVLHTVIEYFNYNKNMKTLNKKNYNFLTNDITNIEESIFKNFELFTKTTDLLKKYLKQQSNFAIVLLNKLSKNYET